jgi:c-di-GMP-binding flagellar brake protein YcgR
MSERRATPRHSLVLSAEIRLENSGPTTRARVSDLSVGGCYVDTMNPFPVGTMIHLRLTHSGETFESKAQVVCEAPRMGMGMAFLETPPAQLELLERWLAAAPPA